MWILIAAHVVGDVLLAALLMRERRSHQKSRAALDYWRRRNGLTPVLLEDVDRDMAQLRTELRGRVQQYRANQAQSHGDAA